MMKCDVRLCQIAMYTNMGCVKCQSTLIDGDPSEAKRRMTLIKKTLELEGILRSGKDAMISEGVEQE